MPPSVLYWCASPRVFWNTTGTPHREKLAHLPETAAKSLAIFFIFYGTGTPHREKLAHLPGTAAKSLAICFIFYGARALAVEVDPEMEFPISLVFAFFALSLRPRAHMGHPI